MSDKRRFAFLSYFFFFRQLLPVSPLILLYYYKDCWLLVLHRNKKGGQK